MTPFELDILLHYYCRGDDHRVVSENPPIWKETRQMFLDENLLRQRSHTERDNSYAITERSKVLIEHILSLPLPKWTMPKDAK